MPVFGWESALRACASVRGCARVAVPRAALGSPRHPSSRARQGVGVQGVRAVGEGWGARAGDGLRMVG